MCRDWIRRGIGYSDACRPHPQPLSFGRTFIEPQQSIRHFGIHVKLNPVRSILDGKRVVYVDGTLVRGTTSQRL